MYPSKLMSSGKNIAFQPTQSFYLFSFLLHVKQSRRTWCTFTFHCLSQRNAGQYKKRFIEFQTYCSVLLIKISTYSNVDYCVTLKIDYFEYCALCLFWYTLKRVYNTVIDRCNIHFDFSLKSPLFVFSLENI